MSQPIAERYRRMREEIPAHVTIVLAAKTRRADEVRAAIEAGATDVGHNYVQEAVAMHEQLGGDAGRVRWHMIGHLQKNKINKVLPITDMIQTVDSLRTARAVAARTRTAGRDSVDTLIEINSGGEDSKTGIPPEETERIMELAEGIESLPQLSLRGLMTMAPWFDHPERARPYFRTTRRLFEQLRRDIPTADLSVLSMGMSDSYRVAVDEGSTMVRLGTVLFGPR